TYIKYSYLRNLFINSLSKESKIPSLNDIIFCPKASPSSLKEMAANILARVELSGRAWVYYVCVCPHLLLHKPDVIHTVGTIHIFPNNTGCCSKNLLYISLKHLDQYGSRLESGLNF